MPSWSPQSLFMFAINESTFTGVCDASAEEESPLWRYVKHELNTLAWVSLIVVTVILLRRLRAVLRLMIMGRRLPGPHTRALNGQSVCLAKAQGPQMLQDFLAGLHEEHGPVVKIWTGPAQLLVSIKDTHIMKRMLEHANDRVPTPRMALQLVYGQRSIFFSDYCKASKSRVDLDKEINGKLLGKVHNISVKIAANVTQWAEPAKNNGWQLDCMSFSRLLAFAALGTSLFGEEYMTWPVAREFEKVMLNVAEEVAMWMPYRVPPIWNAKFNKFKGQCQRLNLLARQLVALGGQMNFQESKGIAVNENMLAGLAEALIECSISSTVVESSGADTGVAGIMSHGALNIAGILSSVLTQLAVHPHIQAKVYDEILIVSGSKELFTEEDMMKMNYLRATVYEATRLLPVAPFLQRCSLYRDLELEPGLVVPAGTVLAAPVQLIQQDRVYWGEDAKSFNPDRFLSALTAEETLVGECLYKSSDDSQASGMNPGSSGVFGLNPAILMFGTGSRSCIGSNFALKQIITLVAVILQQFQLEQVLDGPECKAASYVDSNEDCSTRILLTSR